MTSETHGRFKRWFWQRPRAHGETIADRQVSVLELFYDLWTALSEGGEEGPCGWLKDRYGLPWQIMPVRLTELLNDPDEAATQRVMSAMLQMTKIDIAELERAYAAGA